MNKQNKNLKYDIERHLKNVNLLKENLSKVIVGQKDVIEKTIIAILANGNILLEGAPGLAKTLLVKTIAECSSCDFSRIQFTPDLLPADIIGTKIFNQKVNNFETKKGPIFANFVLADEINRAPAKTQSALLEAMAEKQVTILGESYVLDMPFLVFATQNPIEQEGTYPLPEAQIDRFMFKLLVEYPTKQEEIEILDRMTNNVVPKVDEVISGNEICDIQKLIREIYVDDLVKEYIVSLVDCTRNPADYDLDLGKFIEWGASPRANINLTLASKVCAFLDGRDYVNSDDVKKVARDVLRHRIILNYEADIENINSENLIDEILEKVKCP